METVLEACRDAIDGGYSKTKHIGLVFTPGKDGGETLELRGVKAEAVLDKISQYRKASRFALCFQRSLEDGMYVVSSGFLISGGPLLIETRLYPVPLDDSNFKIVAD